MPSPEEAFTTLQRLADVFLNGGSPSDETLPWDEAGSPRRTATVLVDHEGRIRGLDPEAERVLGRAAADLVDVSALTFFGEMPEHGKTSRCSVERPKGTFFAVWVTRSDLRLGHEPYAVLTLHENDPGIERRTQLRYRHLVEQIPAVVFTASLSGGLRDLYVSPQIESLLGYSQAQWIAEPILWYERLHVDDRPKLDEEFARGCMSGGPFRAECRFLTRTNKIVWVHGEARLIRDERGLPILLQGVAFDISETKRAEELVRASLREKETLLQEIHHRVKNNLQVSSSLLRLQVDRIEDPGAQNALREAQNRIRSMALVHELLYRSKDLTAIDLGEYIRDLVRQLMRAHRVDPSRIVVEMHLDHVSLPIDFAVPCGMILNEVVSNAMKHAFPAGKQGTIRIDLRAGDAFHELVVRDDGIGMPSAFDADAKSLGLRLIRTLADQIGGKLDIRTEAGTEVRLHIPRKPEPST